jgi:hypothetical protein
MKIVGFFCEDIRQETAGTETIVGALPDNMNVPVVPGMFSKLAVYLRVQIDLNEALDPIIATLKTPWGETFKLGEAGKEILDEAQQGAKDSNLPIAGVVIRAAFTPFPVKDYGLITVMAEVGSVERVCAVLNIKPTKPTPTASAQPASQSQPAS